MWHVLIFNYVNVFRNKIIHVSNLFNFNSEPFWQTVHSDLSCFCTVLKISFLDTTLFFYDQTFHFFLFLFSFKMYVSYFPLVGCYSRLNVAWSTATSSRTKRLEKKKGGGTWPFTLGHKNTLTLMEKNLYITKSCLKRCEFILLFGINTITSDKLKTSLKRICFWSHKFLS